MGLLTAVLKIYTYNLFCKYRMEKGGGHIFFVSKMPLLITIIDNLESQNLESL